MTVTADSPYVNLQRETSHRVYSSDEGTTCLETTTAFIGVSGNRTTQLPRIYTTLRTDGENSTRPGGYTGFTYAYDANGNITAINETNGSDSRTKTYTYDALNRLIQDVDPVTGKTTTYTYDARGNILSKTASGETISYTYGDSTWPDLLTAYNGQTISYDTIGNPLTYRGMNFTWQQGRQLASTALANGTAITYRYNPDGIRIGKTVGNVSTEYLVDASGTIHAMKQGEHTLIFMYDATGRREGFICYSDTYGDAAYYYLYNAQGDVIGLTDGTLNTVVQYTYDAWGKPTGMTGSKAATIGVLNPFRYRGYVYDTESGLYYLQSRYYDAETGRFINADAYLSTGQGINGCNMFAYCGNNPVRNKDITGTRYIDALSIACESSDDREVMCGIQREVVAERQTQAKISTATDGDVPYRGEPGSRVVSPDGTKERIYGPNGLPLRDRHHTDHGNPKEHPEVPHDHDWGYNKEGNWDIGPWYKSPSGPLMAPSSNSNSTRLPSVTLSNPFTGDETLWDMFLNIFSIFE